MARWSSWGAMRKYQIKLKSMTLRGFDFSQAHELFDEKTEIQKGDNFNNNKVMAVEVKWKGPTKKKSFPTIKFQHLRNVSRDVAVPRNGDPLVIVCDEDEFKHTCNFSILSPSSKDDTISYGSWDVSFHLLLGEESKKKKMRDIGKGTVDLGELLMVSEMEDHEIHHSVPVTYHFDGQPPRQATLFIVLSFIEMKVSHSQEWSSSCDSAELIPSSNKPQDSFMMRAKSFGLSQGKKKRTKNHSQATTHNSSTSEESGSCSMTPLEIPEDKHFGFWIWKRRGSRVSYKRSKTITDHLDSHLKGGESEATRASTSDTDNGRWEVKELKSRDGRAKLKAKVFFAMYDQRSEKAAGESACAAIVAMFAHWLQPANTAAAFMPTRLVFNQLIAEGSSEWRRLCQDESRRAEFPDSHLDLDTVLKAELRPLTVLRERSHVGFFSPDKFKYLAEAKSFDAIWKEMNEINPLPAVYIVSWNDHFFVLKVGPEACYIVDSLGERLYEGCDRAYILEFDDSSVMYGKVEKDRQGNEKSVEEEEDVIICKGKDCCREYIKRFLAAIAVRELKEEEEKGTVNVFKLHKRLQIEFHYSSSSDPSASTSRTESPINDR